MANAPQKSPSGIERRDSPRVPMKFLVRDVAEGGSFEEYEGDLAVGGAYFYNRQPPAGDLHEVRFHLPHTPKDVRVVCELVRTSKQLGGLGYHLRFRDLDVASELAIAKYFDELHLPKG